MNVTNDGGEALKKLRESFKEYGLTGEEKSSLVLNAILSLDGEKIKKEYEISKEKQTELNEYVDIITGCFNEYINKGEITIETKTDYMFGSFSIFIFLKGKEFHITDCNNFMRCVKKASVFGISNRTDGTMYIELSYTGVLKKRRMNDIGGGK